MDELKPDLLALTDEALASAAWQQRREALHGNRHAIGRAHDLEQELRRRSGHGISIGVRTAGSNVDSKPRPWWQFWRS